MRGEGGGKVEGEEKGEGGEERKGGWLLMEVVVVERERMREGEGRDRGELYRQIRGIYDSCINFLLSQSPHFLKLSLNPLCTPALLHNHDKSPFTQNVKNCTLLEGISDNLSICSPF